MEILKSKFRYFKRKLKFFIGGGNNKKFSEVDFVYSILVDNAINRVMIDVGAQFGESFGPFADAGWQIIAFEPDPNPKKQDSLVTKEKGRVEVLRVALSDIERPDATFYTSEESTGISSLAAFRPSHQPTAVVKVTTLEKVLKSRTIKGVDFLKIDTEGHDLFVLKGFPWSASVLKPRVILCEFEDSKTTPLGYDWMAMADFIERQGYRVYVSEWFPIERYGTQHKWRSVKRYPAELKDSNGWGNLVAFRDLKDAADFENLTFSL